MMFSVRIYQLNRAFELWRWLCLRCLRELQSEGWKVKQSKEPPHALCCDGEGCRR